MADDNACFRKAPANPKDLHRPLTVRDDLGEAITWRETRTITKTLTLHYDRMVYILDQTPAAPAAAGKTAKVVEYPMAASRYAMTVPNCPIASSTRTAASAKQRWQRCHFYMGWTRAVTITCICHQRAYTCIT